MFNKNILLACWLLIFPNLIWARGGTNCSPFPACARAIEEEAFTKNLEKIRTVLEKSGYAEVCPVAGYTLNDYIQELPRTRPVTSMRNSCLVIMADSKIGM